MKHMYRELNEDYFDFLAERSANPVRRWFHNTRFQVARNLVLEHYKGGMTVVDLGCGSCNWNSCGIPVVGIDSEAEVLRYAEKKGRVSKIYCRDINNTRLRGGSVHIVTLFGVLEHIPNYMHTLKEAHRILKPKGIIISSVPHDTVFSLWKPLFGLHCFIQGTLLRKPYFLDKAGHVNAFSPKSIESAYERAGFKVIKQFSKARMEIYTVGRKE
jgi:2-polyprenyl-3-methyl-5-hydroxy-6-metoxy-1,4-benzoquinol methylase